ncbi:MAG: hypothetical protein LBH93_02720 [Chitinispirillales bacterium]|jgi:hypothetical protein|nr:hypothetical protein [Chitinispirillales bacterium]
MKKAVFTIASFCAALSINAQSPLGLSYPLGVPDIAVTGAAAAMGGGGTALAEEYLGTSLNPANAAIGERSAFSALVSFDATGISDNGKSSMVSGYMPKLLSLIIPIGKAGNIGFSMQQRYDANLNFYTREARKIDSITTSTSTIELHRNGGLTAWQAGWAYRFANGIGVGLQYERFYFKRDTREVFESVFTYELASGANPYRASTTENATANIASDGVRFGMQVPVHEKVTLGFAGEYILPGTNNGSATREYRRSDTSAALSDTSYSFSADLPPYMNIGAAYKLDDHWLFTADAYTTLWEYYENDLEPTLAEADRCFGISVGARFIPAANVLSSKYWEKIHYSAGARYATLPNNKAYDRASEYALTLGAGLPIPNDGGMVDIVFSFGKRSDPRYDGYGENIVKIQLGLNGGRDWFQKDASKNY